MLFLKNPLSSSAIDGLLGAAHIRPSIETITQKGCVMSSSPTIWVIHPSFSDFLLTRSRCNRDIWLFEKGDYNYTLAIHCLQRFDSTLRWNMCNLTLSANLEDESLADDGSYACLFWTDHICVIDGYYVSRVIDHFDAFMNRHLLHWFEAMSILRRSRDTIMPFRKLSVWANVSVPPHSISS